jgi:hypothetical protein
MCVTRYLSKSTSQYWSNENGWHHFLFVNNFWCNVDIRLLGKEWVAYICLWMRFCHTALSSAVGARREMVRLLVLFFGFLVSGSSGPQPPGAGLSIPSAHPSSSNRNSLAVRGHHKCLRTWKGSKLIAYKSDSFFEFPFMVIRPLWRKIGRYSECMWLLIQCVHKVPSGF